MKRLLKGDKKPLREDTSPNKKKRVNADQSRTTLLMRGLKSVRTGECSKFYLECKEDSLDTMLFHMPSFCFLNEDDAVSSSIGQGIEMFAEKFHKPAEILSEIHFPADFPTSPPFVRIKYPRFQYRTGHVTIGGSICTPLLTSAHWNPYMTFEGLLLFIQQTLIDGGAEVVLERTYHHPFPHLEYSLNEARSAFVRVAKQHGWKTS